MDVEKKDTEDLQKEIARLESLNGTASKELLCFCCMHQELLKRDVIK